MPLLPAPAPAVQVPSHLPSQATVAPASAVQLPEHSPVQVPVHLTSGASALTLQLPLHSTLSLPPSHLGSSAMASHMPSTEQLPSQLAWASMDTLQAGGWKSTVSSPLTVALAPKVASICAVARAHMSVTRSFSPLVLAA